MNRIDPERYARQLVLPAIGPEGQARLAAARLALSGEWAALRGPVRYLAGAGVGGLAVAAEDFAALNREVTPRNPGIRLEVWPRGGVPPDGGGFSLALLVGSPDEEAWFAPWRRWGLNSGVPLLLLDPSRLPALSFPSEENDAPPPLAEPWRTLNLGLLGMMAASETLLTLLGRAPTPTAGVLARTDGHCNAEWAVS
ncbi:MAG: hypothetical protein HQL51_15880, partial [Magnetococcales bacterium]|nr:hypothetical protein [Magnetococcales bacterium]